MNMTSITILNHPDYQRLSQRSSIVITPFSQPGISSKSRVHLLKSLTTDPNPYINTSIYTTTEIGAFLMSKKGFTISRTNVHLRDINIYGSDVNYNIFPIHLQEKVAKIENMFLNSTGSGLFPMNPLSIHAENITCDMMKGMSCIEASYAF